MGRNYRFLLYGSRSQLPGLLNSLAAMADPPAAAQLELKFADSTLSFAVDPSQDKNPASLDLSQPSCNLELLSWFSFEHSLPDQADAFIREHWAPDNQEHLAAGRFRFWISVEITLSANAYEVALSSPTSSGSMIFSFSPNVRNAFLQLLEKHQVWFGLFDSEQAVYKVLPRRPEAGDSEWGVLQLSFEEEDLILQSDKKLDACIQMLQRKIQAMPEGHDYLLPRL